MVDFVDEVEEQLRSDRYRALARQYLPWVGAALAAMVIGWLGVWGYNAWQSRNVGKASVAYDKGVTALSSGDETGAYTDFETIGRSGPRGYKTLALMQEGNIRLAANKPLEAASFYDAAGKAAPNAILGDLARLKAALALLETAPYPQLRTRLNALIGAGKPYDLSAKEALAMAKLEAGKYSEARGDFSALSITLGVTDAMRARAQAAIALIDSGQGPVAVQVVRAAATLPPPAQPTFPASPQGAAPPAGQARAQAQDTP
ncbi:MAG TPA: tetratricopeptide repeat protein [Caulobacteraceae bacterium]